MMRRLLLIIFLLLLLLCAGVAGAEDSPLSFGADIGYATEIRLIGRRQSSRVQIGISHLQMNGRLLQTDGLLRNVQLINEIVLAQSIHPGSRFIFGANEMVRLNFKAGDRWTIYSDTGIGISSFGLRVHEVSGWMQYMLQFGGGFAYRPHNSRIAYQATYRLTHFSNNRTRRPNDGLNLNAFFVGIHYYPK